MKFEWDEKKAAINLKKHGIGFPLAATVFDDPCALIAPDAKHSDSVEKREWIIGMSEEGVLVVVFTKRCLGQIYRIISARKASKKERKIYEEYKRIPL